MSQPCAKLAEDQLVVIGCDATARIRDLDENEFRARLPPHAASRNSTLGRRRRELERIAEQVHQDVQ
jgi:hypothetical protein